MLRETALSCDGDYWRCEDIQRAEVGFNFRPDLLRTTTRAREMNGKYGFLSFLTTVRADLPTVSFNQVTRERGCRLRIGNIDSLPINAL